MIANVVKSIPVTGLTYPDVVVSDGATPPALYRRVRVVVGRYPTCPTCSAHMQQQGVAPNQIARAYTVACDADGNYTDTPTEFHLVCHFQADAIKPDWDTEIDGLRQAALADWHARQHALAADDELPLEAPTATSTAG